MLETLLKILSWDLPAPEILLEEDGCIGLDWHTGYNSVSVSIASNGGLAWASISECGTDMERLAELLQEMFGE